MPQFLSSAQRIPVGPGTLYVATLGTAEPTSVTGAMPAGWVTVGFTDKGNDFSWKPTFQDVEVDEELMPVRKVPSAYSGTVAFSAAEVTQQNLALALNAGIGASLDTASQGVNPDGSVWQEPVAFGAEVHVMVAWDAASEGATPVNSTPLLGRVIYRECLQTGEIKSTHQKGNNKWLIPFTFDLIKPASGLQPFREIFPANVAS